MEGSGADAGDQLVARVGDGHGRRLLILDPEALVPAVALAGRLSARGWAVSVCGPDELVAAGRDAAEDAGVVVAWLRGRPDALPCPDGGFAVIVCGTRRGILDAPVVGEAARALRADGRLVVAASAESALAGLEAVS